MKTQTFQFVIVLPIFTVVLLNRLVLGKPSQEFEAVRRPRHYVDMYSGVSGVSGLPTIDPIRATEDEYFGIRHERQSHDASLGEKISAEKISKISAVNKEIIHKLEHQEQETSETYNCNVNQGNSEQCTGNTNDEINQGGNSQLQDHQQQYSSQEVAPAQYSNSDAEYSTDTVSSQNSGTEQNNNNNNEQYINNNNEQYVNNNNEQYINNNNEQYVNNNNEQYINNNNEQYVNNNNEPQETLGKFGQQQQQQQQQHKQQQQQNENLGHPLKDPFTQHRRMFSIPPSSQGFASMNMKRPMRKPFPNRFHYRRPHMQSNMKFSIFNEGQQNGHGFLSDEFPTMMKPHRMHMQNMRMHQFPIQMPIKLNSMQSSHPIHLQTSSSSINRGLNHFSQLQSTTSLHHQSTSQNRTPRKASTYRPNKKSETKVKHKPQHHTSATKLNTDSTRREKILLRTRRL